MTEVCGIAPEAILTMTYTVAATQEMRARFAARFGGELAARLEFRTINGVAARIIALYSRMYGRTPPELIRNESETTPLLMRLWQDTNHEYPAESTVKDLRTAITYIKNMCLTDAELDELETDIENLPDLYRGYQKALKAAHKMDYDDQLCFALQILRGAPAVAREAAQGEGQDAGQELAEPPGGPLYDGLRPRRGFPDSGLPLARGCGRSRPRGTLTRRAARTPRPRGGGGTGLRCSPGPRRTPRLVAEGREAVEHGVAPPAPDLAHRELQVGGPDPVDGVAVRTLGVHGQRSGSGRPGGRRLRACYSNTPRRPISGRSNGRLRGAPTGGRATSDGRLRLRDGL